MARVGWETNRAFILATIGATAGLGNVWRFPFMTYSNGGGAFLVPYLVAFLTIGIPLFILEMAIGQRQQSNAPGAWGAMRTRFTGIGWWGLGVSSVLVLYFSAIVAWIYDYIYYAFTVAWRGRAESFFFQDVLNASSGPGDITGVSVPVAIAVLVTWALIYLTLFKGTKLMSKIIKVIVPLPIILLIVLIVRGITLDGGLMGISYFLQPDFSALLSADVWISAYTQVFFSVGVGMSILISYASYRYVHSEITKTTVFVAISEMAISFMAGFAVFSTLGYLALEQGVGVQDVARGGAELVFIAFPTAIELMPTGSVAMGVLFFITILALAHSSAISFIKAIAGAMSDEWGWSNMRASGLVCIALCACSLLFATNAGFYWVEIVDHFANNYGVTAVCLAEVLAIGWAHDLEETRRWICSISAWRIGIWWTYLIKYAAPLIIGSIIVLSAWADFVARSSAVMQYPLWTIAFVMGIIAVAVPVLSWIVLPRKASGDASADSSENQGQDL